MEQIKKPDGIAAVQNKISTRTCDACNGDGWERDDDNKILRCREYGDEDDGWKAHCNRCHGSGELYNADAILQCNLCEGVGYKAIEELRKDPPPSPCIPCFAWLTPPEWRECRRCEGRGGHRPVSDDRGKCIGEPLPKLPPPPDSALPPPTYSQAQIDEAIAEYKAQQEAE